MRSLPWSTDLWHCGAEAQGGCEVSSDFEEWGPGNSVGPTFAEGIKLLNESQHRALVRGRTRTARREGNGLFAPRTVACTLGRTSQRNDDCVSVQWRPGMHVAKEQLRRSGGPPWSSFVKWNLGHSKRSRTNTRDWWQVDSEWHKIGGDPDLAVIIYVPAE